MSAIDNLNLDIRLLATAVTNFNFRMHGGGHRYTLSGISLSGNSFLGNASNPGDLIGNISVQAIGGTFSGTLSITGTDRTKFQISSNQFQVAIQSPPGLYDINIVATPSDSRIAPLAVNFPIIGASLELNLNPAFETTIPSGTIAGTVVATLQGVWSNGAPFTGSYIFVAPNFNDGGLYLITLNPDRSGLLKTAQTITSTVNVDEVVSIEATQ